MSAPRRKPIIDDIPELPDEFDELPHGRGSVRTLKPPPEIWELVHPVATNKYKPGRVLATRVASRKVLMVLAGLLALGGIGLALWKYPIVQNVVAMWPKDDVPSKVRTPKTTPGRAVQPDSRSKVAVTSESLNTSVPDVLPNPDVIATSITSTRAVKQLNRRLNRANVERHNVSSLATPPTTNSEPVTSTASRSIAKAQAESPVKSQPKTNAPAQDGNSASDSKQSAKPKVIPWP